MNGCTETGKPRIAILMAVYEPRMDWLREQLLSLNAQTYPNLRLYVRDDGSAESVFAEITACLQNCITAFPYEIARNEKNLGSNKTFERLTQDAQGKFFAYCDQDDVWHEDKLEILELAMRKSNALLVCSDVYIIDAGGNRTADSITEVRRHHVFLSGKGLAPKLLFRNFVTGCTMLVQAQEAKAAIPFCPYMVHDQYIALWCAAHGSVMSLPRQLVDYRIHGGNQTGLLTGVTDKASYGAVRIKQAVLRMQWLNDNFPCGDSLRQTIREALLWAQARERSWTHHGGANTVWKYRHFSCFSAVAEILLRSVPEKLFMKAVRLAQKNRV